MAVIEKFLGRQLTLPDNLRYFVKQGLLGKTGRERNHFCFFPNRP
jgi:hypothetical protein